MASLLTLKNVRDNRGSLTVIDNIESVLPFPLKRIFYIQDASGTRGGHRHYNTRHAVICIAGSCIVTVDDGNTEQDYFLDDASQCLVLDPSDWHTMHHFSPGAILLALASTNYSADDYIYTPYPKMMANGTV